jgi:transglutaminase-like putative cysteine protease
MKNVIIQKQAAGPAFKRNAGKIIRPLAFTAVFAAMLFAFSITAQASAPAALTAENQRAKICFAEANDTGVVSVNLTLPLDGRKIKVRVESEGLNYDYDLRADGHPELFPLQWGNGEYTVRVMIQIPDPVNPYRFSLALQANFVLELSNPHQPFLNANQLVHFTGESETAALAAELSLDSEDDFGKIEAMYSWVVENIGYNNDLARRIQNGEVEVYVPDVDEIIGSGLGICFDYSAVFAAMLRSQGIPAKLVMGWVRVPGQEEPLYHAWNEFYNAEEGGWFRINEMKFGGLRFERVDPTFDSGNNSSSAAIKWISDCSNYVKVWEF